MIDSILGKVNGESRFAVYASGAMLVFVTLVRLASFRVLGHDDTILLQAQQAMVTLFTGSIVLDRAATHSKGKSNGTNGTTTN